MAKVKGPLMSMEASGKVGNAIVFSVWKGSAYVRKWLKPKNAMSDAQAIIRVVQAGVGASCGKVKVTSAYEGQLITLNRIPSGQSKQSFLVKYVRDHYCKLAADYTSILAAYNAHTAKTDFESSALEIGLIDFNLSYGSAVTFPAGLGLYMLALTAIALGFTGTPYSVAIGSWTSTQIDLLVADLAAA